MFGPNYLINKAIIYCFMASYTMKTITKTLIVF